jgi:hypothetical protein
MIAPLFQIVSQKAKASQKSNDYDKYSEAAEEIIVPKLILAPTSNHHNKWKKQILKQLKKDFGPIHEAVVSKCYPNFQEESMQIICTPPEEVFNKLSKVTRSQQSRPRKPFPPGDDFQFSQRSSTMKVQILPTQIILHPKSPQLI